MNRKLSDYIKFVTGCFISGAIGWGIGIYMDRPDISYYVQKNKQASIRTINSQKILTSWYRTKKNRKQGETYSSSVYIRNTGHHSYKGEDFSHTKEPLRIETDSPIELFAIDDTKSAETTVSIKDNNGIYYIEFDFLNYGKSMHFVFTHAQPIKYLHVKGSGVDLPYIRENAPLKIWAYRHFFLVILIFIVASILLSVLLSRVILRIVAYKTPESDKEYYQLLQQFSVAKNKKTKKEILNKIGTLLEENAAKLKKGVS